MNETLQASLGIRTGILTIGQNNALNIYLWHIRET